MEQRDTVHERIYKSAWHIALLLVGIHELKTHKSKFGKFLAAGLILFHADAAVSDALDCKCGTRRVLEMIVGPLE